MATRRTFDVRRINVISGEQSHSSSLSVCAVAAGQVVRLIASVTTAMDTTEKNVGFVRFIAGLSIMVRRRDGLFVNLPGLSDLLDSLPRDAGTTGSFLRVACVCGGGVGSRVIGGLSATYSSINRPKRLQSVMFPYVALFNNHDG